MHRVHLKPTHTYTLKTHTYIKKEICKLMDKGFYIYFSNYENYTKF